MKKSISGLLVMFVTLTTVNADPVQTIMKKFLENPVELSYDLEIFWSMREITEKNRGELLLDEPNKSFVFSFNESKWVSDGVGVWQYSADTKQLIIQDYLDFDTNLHPSNFLKGFEDYTFTEAGKKGSVVEYVWAKSEDEKDEYAKISVFYNSKKKQLVKIVLVDIDENISTYSFDKITFLDAVEEGRFVMTTPEGAEVIDNR